MSSLRTMAVGLGLASVLSAAGGGSFAQGPGMPVGAGAGGGLGRSVAMPGGANYVLVLMSPAVQTELKMTEDQKTKVFELAREAQQKGRVMMQSMFQAGGNAQVLMSAGMRLRQENEAAGARILKPEQKSRVDEIMLQIEGPLAVARPEVAARLNMTPKQNQQVQVTQMQMFQALREMAMAQGGNNGFGPAGLPREAINQVRRAANQQLGRILDAKQRFNFDKMLGEPFDLAKIDPELARPAATTGATTGGPAPSKAEKSRTRRKGAAAAKGTAAKDAGDDVAPKP